MADFSDLDDLVLAAEMSFSRPVEAPADPVASSEAPASPAAPAVPLVPVAQMRERHDKARLTFSRLQGQRFAAAKQAEELHNRVAAAKTRLAHAEEVGTVLNELQARANSRSVGVFEKLLTAVLADVLPEEGVIKLELDMRGNSPSLDISLDKDGMLCDVLEATGGAVTNVVCTGLKFAALSRTANRKFIVLDEPDCWLKPERVPAFMKVLADVAQQTRTQTMFVSHHDPEMFSDGVTLVRLSRNEAGKVSAAALEPVAATWADDAEPGIRAIELENFMSHEHTVIPCFPGATALIGDNNLGKSAALVSALKAVAFGESSDKLIRYGQASARVVLHLENKRRVVWTRDPKRNPVTFYELWEGDIKVREGKSPARNQAPDWVSEVLGIARVDGLDLQLGSQKSPVFLLDQPSSTRAQILSLGRESSHVLTLMQRYDELKRSDRDLVKNREPEVQRLYAQLGVLDALDEIESVLESNDKPLKGLEYSEGELKALADLVGRVAQVEAAVSAMAQRADALAQLPQPPVLLEVAGLSNLVSVMAAAGERLKAQEIEVPEVEAPQLLDTAELVQVGRAWARAEKMLTVAPLVEQELPAAPVLTDMVELDSLVARYASAEKAAALAEREATEAETAYQQAVQEFEVLMEQLGGHCPLCGATHEKKEMGHV